MGNIQFSRGGEKEEKNLCGVCQFQATKERSLNLELGKLALETNQSKLAPASSNWLQPAYPRQGRADMHFQDSSVLSSAICKGGELGKAQALNS